MLGVAFASASLRFCLERSRRYLNPQGKLKPNTNAMSSKRLNRFEACSIQRRENGNEA